MVEELGRAKRVVRMLLSLLSIILFLIIFDCTSLLIDPVPVMRAMTCRVAAYTIPFSVGGVILLTVLIEKEKRRLYELLHDRYNDN